MDLVRGVFWATPFYGKIRNFQHRLEAIFQVIKSGYPAKDLTVIGVTGTDGKTTVVHLIGAILQTAGYKTAVISTLGAFFDGRKVDSGLHVTTPDPSFLQPLLVRVKNVGISYVVLEATSHGLDQHRLLGCNFKVGVLTNITHEHLDYHQTFERYRQAKAKLFAGVKIAVLNCDDPSFGYLKSKTGAGATIIGYGVYHPAQLRAQKMTATKNGMRFEVRQGRQTIPVQTSLTGEYNVANVLAAAAVGRGLGIDWDSIVAAIGGFGKIAGRMDYLRQGQQFDVIIDFAHTPAALEQLLQTLQNRKKPNGKLIVVFGSAGERDVGKRKLMGQVAARLADFSVLTSEDPRSEDPDKIIDDITRGIRQSARMWDGVAPWRVGGKWCIRVPERGEAIAFAIQTLAQAGDMVVICGKGHEKSMAIAGREYPWSDQEAAGVALRGGVKRVGDGR